MNVEIYVPWGGNEAERADRSRQMMFVYERLAAWFPDWISGLAEETGGLEFSKARAINWAADQSQADVVVFNDADSLVPPEQLRRAARIAYATEGFVRAFTDYRKLSESTTLHVLAGNDDPFEAPYHWSQPNPPSHGVAAFDRRWFVDLGGYDPRLMRWYDDICFEHVCREYRREWRPSVAGPLVHLHHSERPMPPGDEELYARYCTEPSPAAIRSEAGWPC